MSLRQRFFRRRPSAFARNRPILRSPVMARFDALFADPDANAAIYEAVLEDLNGPITPDVLRRAFAAHGPDGSARGVGATSEDVVDHVFEHILGPNSWWGRAAAGWRGEELLAAGYRDAVERAQAAGNIPIKTFHLQGSPDDRLQVHVLDAARVILVLIATPPVPSSVPNPDHYKVYEEPDQLVAPMEARMGEVSSYTVDTLWPA